MLPQVKLGALRLILSPFLDRSKAACIVPTWSTVYCNPVLAAVYGPYGRLVTYYKKLEGLIMFRQNTQYIQLHWIFLYIYSVHVYYVCRLPCQ